MADSIRDLSENPEYRLGINCSGCGTMRLLPEGIKVGDRFQLVTCPRCWTPPIPLILTDEGVEQVIQ